MIKEAEVRTRRISGFVRTRAFLERGGSVIMRGSTGSTPRDCAGGPSINISTTYKQAFTQHAYRVNRWGLTDP